MIKASIDTVTVVLDKAPAPMRIFIVESGDRVGKKPVLVFLHGKGEASGYQHALSLVCNHSSPPFQALLGRLRDVTVVAPQAPNDPSTEWNWRDYVPELCRYVTERFPEQEILASGFSRGGLGVLQLVHCCPQRIKKWALVDPQRARDEEEEEKLLSVIASEATGWLRYGNGIPRNLPFAERLATHLPPERVGFVDLGHCELAVAAYQSEKLDGGESVYEFFGLEYR
ncbi:MAG: hypothetical protein ACRED0_09515 [Gammaproteobacteria bacterium]